MTHVDDYVTSFDGDKYARWVLMHFRLPAVLKMLSDEFLGDAKLFCTWRGRRYRVTGASRIGDVWLTENFDRDRGYEHRVEIDECSEWGPEA